VSAKLVTRAAIIRDQIQAMFDGAADAALGISMQDPRDSKFHKLRKRDPDQLTSDEARHVQEICTRMMDYVGNGANRKQWEELAGLYSVVANTGDARPLE